MRTTAKALLVGAFVVAAVLGPAGVAEAHTDSSGQTCLSASCHTYDLTVPVSWTLVSVPGHDPAIYEVPVGLGDGWAVLDQGYSNVGHASQTGTIALSPYGHYRLWVGHAGGGLGANYVDLPSMPRPTTITIVRSRSSVRGLTPFALSGVITPGALGDLCSVDVRKPKSSRWSYSSARSAYATTPGGGAAWWYRYAPRLKGTYSFRVHFKGDTDRAASMSGVVSVAVR